LGGTYAWTILSLLPLAFCFFYLSLRRKDVTTREGIPITIAATILSLYITASTVGFERGEPHPLIPSWIFQLVCLAAFAALIVTYILLYTGVIEKAKKKIRLAVTSAVFTIITAMMILDNSLDLPYIICVVLVNSLFAVTAIRRPEPVKGSK